MSISTPDIKGTFNADACQTFERMIRGELRNAVANYIREHSVIGRIPAEEFSRINDEARMSARQRIINEDLGIQEARALKTSPEELVSSSDYLARLVLQKEDRLRPEEYVPEGIALTIEGEQFTA